MSQDESGSAQAAQCFHLSDSWGQVKNIMINEPRWVRLSPGCTMLPSLRLLGPGKEYNNKWAKMSQAQPRLHNASLYQTHKFYIDSNKFKSIMLQIFYKNRLEMWKLLFLITNYGGRICTNCSEKRIWWLELKYCTYIMRGEAHAQIL